jgi:putative flippase GtrA
MIGGPAELYLRVRQFSRYLLTGGAAAVIDVGGFALLNSSGMGVAEAAILSFLAALIVNYCLSARFAFARELSLQRFLLFAGFAGVGLLINVSVTLAAFAILDHAVLSKIMGVGIAFIFNFIINAFLVFR